MIVLAMVVVLEFGVWSGGYVFQRQFSRADEHKAWDWSNPKATGPIILILSCGLLVLREVTTDMATDYIVDSAFQGLAYYTMSSMSNNPFKLARLAGCYKGLQSAGTAVAFGMDAVATPYMTELLVSWIMTLVVLIPAGYVLWRLPDSSIGTEGAVYVDELKDNEIGGAAMPSGHHTLQPVEMVEEEEENTSKA